MTRPPDRVRQRRRGVGAPAPALEPLDDRHRRPLVLHRARSAASTSRTARPARDSTAADDSSCCSSAPAARASRRHRGATRPLRLDGRSRSPGSDNRWRNGAVECVGRARRSSRSSPRADVVVDERRVGGRRRRRRRRSPAWSSSPRTAPVRRAAGPGTTPWQRAGLALSPVEVAVAVRAAGRARRRRAGSTRRRGTATTTATARSAARR